MVSLKAAVIAALLAYTSTIFAHPGHDLSQEVSQRGEFFKRDPRTLKDCASQLATRRVKIANYQRLDTLATTLRAERGLPDSSRLLQRRDFVSYNISHHNTNPSLSLESDETALFADNSSCLLQPDVTEGPYYVSGELIRQDVVEEQEGVPLTLDIQIIDTSTCEPIPAVYLEVWHCNSTGVYSGVVANGNGNMNDTSNVNNTALRGIQETDKNGIVQFNTLFPGHYTGRATHIHLLAHSPNTTTTYLNRTLGGPLTAVHVGQAFFDQTLIAAIDKITPYSTNTQNVTLNSDDSILGQEADSTDPFVEWAMLGSQLEQGLLAWMTVGIDLSENITVSQAAAYYKNGGVVNENSSFMSNGQGNGTAPSNITSV